MTAKSIVKFLVENEVNFSVPGWYDLPSDIVKKSLNEFLKYGKSDLIEKYKDWKNLDLKLSDYIKECNNKYFRYEYELTIYELNKLKRLKRFWNDKTHISELNKLLENEVE